MSIHLLAHSYFSLLEGLASPRQLAEAAAAHGLPALALTDRDRLSGAIEFYDACRESGVQPVLGLEIDVAATPDLGEAQSGTLVLLAMDRTGWGNLCRLSSALLGEAECIAAGRLPFERLAGHNAGLICLSGDERGLLARAVRQRREATATRWLGQLEEVFPGRLYVQLSAGEAGDISLARRLDRLAHSMRLPVVAAHPVYYLQADQAQQQRVAAAMRLNCRLEALPAESIAPPGAYFLPPGEFARRWEGFPAALDASVEIAARCRLELPLGKANYPLIDLPDGESPEAALRAKAYAGARRHYTRITPEIESRLEHELGIIIEKGYASLFLIMADVLRYARQADVPTASRGSAASSLVAHCLDITTPDPLHLDLYFERFLNPARATPPDIDTDISSAGRDQVIQYVYDAYGAERVAMVGTINRFRRRSALREVAKAYGLEQKQINELVAGLPRRGWGPPRAWRGTSDAPYAELAARTRDPRLLAIYRHAAAFIDMPHHLSIHAGGVIIAPGALHDLLPTQMAAKGILISQFDLASVERLGLVKLDLLGIRGLSVLGEVAAGLQRSQPERHASRLAVLDAIPEDDPPTAELVQAGRTIGCFQIESPGMRLTLRETQADSVDDILVALALYRPGPLTGGLKDAFVRRHLGLEAIEHLHPALAPLLQETYGVILYQEQVLRIAHALAGLSLAEADLLRRAMSHFDPGEQMRTLKQKFIRGAQERSAVPPETGERIWELMAAFAGYGFPKAHAASYAQIAWRAAWCKAHFPAEFIAAVLANWGGYYGQPSYLMEARRMGLALRAPHVNHAQASFSVQYLDGEPVLFMGLEQVRELTRRTQRRILQGRPFSSLEDFLARADPRPAEAEHLIQVGALSEMGSIPGMLRRVRGGRWQPDQLPLFTLEAGEAGEDDWTPAQKAAAQERLLGVSVETHLLELLGDRLAEAGAISTIDAAGRKGQTVRVAGVCYIWRRTSDESGGLAYLLALDDLEGSLPALVPQAVYRRHRTALQSRAPLLLEGEIDLDPDMGEPYLRVANVWLLEMEQGTH